MTLTPKMGGSSQYNGCWNNNNRLHMMLGVWMRSSAQIKGSDKACRPGNSSLVQFSQIHNQQKVLGVTDMFVGLSAGSRRSDDVTKPEITKFHICFRRVESDCLNGPGEAASEPLSSQIYYLGLRFNFASFRKLLWESAMAWLSANRNQAQTCGADCCGAIWRTQSQSWEPHAG